MHAVKCEVGAQVRVIKFLQVVARTPPIQGKKIAHDLRQIAGAAKVVHIDLGQFNVQCGGHGGRFGEIKLGIFVAHPCCKSRGIHGIGWGRGQFFILSRLSQCLVFIALAHFASIRIEDQRQMSVGRPAKSERVLQHNMFRGVIEMLLRSQHCGHAHQFIIHHNGKVIGWKTVGFANNKIIHLASWQCGITQNFIVNCDGPRWSLKANHRGFAFFQPRLHLRRRNPIRATSVIAIGLVARLGFLARRVQFRSGIEGVIRLPLLNKLIQILVVNFKTLTLKVGTKVPAAATFKFGSFIPINTEPLQVF